VWPELQLGEGRSFLLGIVATQIACVECAIGSSLSKRRAHDENVLATAAVQMIFAGISLLLLEPCSASGALYRNCRTAAALGYLIVVGSVVGYSAYAYALKYLPVSTVSLYAYANPVIAVVLGSLLLEEPFGPRVLIAAAVIFVGSAMVKGR
jgi:drug/metabolite transporter (DMT)-like permease